MFKINDNYRYVIADKDNEALALQQPRTAAMNTAFDSLISFAEAWLCDPNCPQGLLVWDTTDDDYINYLDYSGNIATFEGAFSSNILYLLTDKDRSVIATSSGAEISYNAWGEPSYTGNIDGLSVLWNGYYFDGETGNYYLKNRYYSPIERQFLTEDPHGTIPDENWNNPFGITNQYTDGYGLQVYAGFNPVNNRDDWGLKNCNRCGPDITSQFIKMINRTKYELSEAFRDGNVKRRVCKSIYSTRGWDVFRPDESISTKDYPKGKDCKDRVVFAGMCVNKWELNYYFWGLLNRLCDNSWLMTDIAANWAYLRPGSPTCKKSFAKAGYFGNYGFIKSGCNNRDKCPTNGSPTWKTMFTPYINGYTIEGGYR